jgi:hypothetical protein
MLGLRRIWSILDPLSINVDAPPDRCMAMLYDAAQPSTDRLHLREAFSEGRRYFIERTSTGFRMTTTSRTLFNRRRRTVALCVLSARIIDAGDARTSLAISARLRLAALVPALWVPVAMVWLLLPVPWPRSLIVGVLGLVVAFGWTAFRYGAALEATEMVFFLYKAFENVPKFSMGRLPPPNDTVVAAHEFDSMWDKFVRMRQTDSEG